MLTEEEKSKRKVLQGNRVTISDRLKDKLTVLSEQATSYLSGITTITKTDIVNLPIDEHDNQLTEVQLSKIKAIHVDPVRYAFWIAEKLKEQRAASLDVTIQDLLRETKAISTDCQIQLPQTHRRERKKNR